MKKIITIVLVFVLSYGLFQLLRYTVFPALDKKIYQLIKPRGIGANPIPDNKEECLAHGGDWGKAGLFPKEFCRFPAGDEGKSCLAGFQCQQGDCLARLNLRKPAIFAIGQCPKYAKNFGCMQWIHFGLTEKGICAD